MCEICVIFYIVMKHENRIKHRLVFQIEHDSDSLFDKCLEGLFFRFSDFWFLKEAKLFLFSVTEMKLDVWINKHKNTKTDQDVVGMYADKKLESASY